MSSNRRNRNIQPDRNNSGGNPGNFNGQPNSNGQPNMNNLGQLLNNVDLNQVMGQLSQVLGTPQGSGPAPKVNNISRDPRVELLQVMKPFVNARRSDMLDKIGQVYSIIRILQKGR